MAKTILRVDDKANMRMLLQEHLTAQDLRGVMAENGRVALWNALQNVCQDRCCLLGIDRLQLDESNELTKPRAINEEG